ncbi:hypothetical protein ATCC90586_000458 [Pythium insidiosum]|nr:hypothetical protein ATCC90586_000458 [Pythium insidiosum]
MSHNDYAREAPTKPAAVAVHVGDSDDTLTSDDVRVGAWDAEIFGCFQHLVPNCLMVTFLPCVAVAQVTHRINLFPYTHVLLAYAAIWGSASALPASR